jgi:mRNA-degrading endonuclease toxin of MazEF toxin-antitoxin module
MDYKQGDIFWVDIPKNETQGSEQFGRRPFLIVSRDAVNKILKTVIAVPMSSNVTGQPPFRTVIPVSEVIKDPQCTSKLEISVAKTDQVRVIDKSRLLPNNKIGYLSRTAILSVLGTGLGFVFDIR